MNTEGNGDLAVRLAEGHLERDSAIQELRTLLIKGLIGALSGKAGNDIAFIEDIAQTASIRILEKLDTFEGRSKFSSWALSIAIRIAFTEMRRKPWREESLDSIRETAGVVESETDPAPGPDETSASKDLSLLVRELIASELTPRQRDVLLLELNGVPQERIAADLNTNRNNIYKIAHDARKALKRSLEAKGWDKEALFGETA